MKTGALIFAGFFVFVGGLLAGMEIGWRQRDSEPEKIVYLTKTCPAKQQPVWACDAVELREYRNTCFNRLKGKNG